MSRLRPLQRRPVTKGASRRDKTTILSTLRNSNDPFRLFRSTVLKVVNFSDTQVCAKSRSFLEPFRIVVCSRQRVDLASPVSFMQSERERSGDFCKGKIQLGQLFPATGIRKRMHSTRQSLHCTGFAPGEQVSHAEIKIDHG